MMNVERFRSIRRYSKPKVVVCGNALTMIGLQHSLFLHVRLPGLRWKLFYSLFMRTNI